jgi:hypothetical protein
MIALLYLQGQFSAFLGAFTALLCKACKWWVRFVLCLKLDLRAVSLRGAQYSLMTMNVYSVEHAHMRHRGVHESTGKPTRRCSPVD